MLTTKPESQDFAVTNMLNELTAESTQISAVNATKMIIFASEEKITTVRMLILLSAWKSLTLPTYTLQAALPVLLPDPSPDVKHK